MKRQLLLKVKSRFLIPNRGLILFPELELASERPFKPHEEVILVSPPDGKEFEVSAQFQIQHFNQSSGNRWSIVALIPDVHIECVPIGSTVYASEELTALIKEIKT